MGTPTAGYPDARRIEPLWDRIDQNRWRLVGYLLGFWIISSVWTAVAVWVVSVVALFVASVAAQRLVGSPPQAALAFATGGAGSLAYVAWALVRSDRWIRRRLGAEIVPKGELHDTKVAVKDMSIAGGLPLAPALYRMPSGNVNAFVFHAVGRRPLLGVTEGFSEKLSVDEQRAVFANLLARIITGDTMVVSAVVVLMAPLHAWRDHRIRILGDDMEVLASSDYQRAARRKAALPPGDVLLLLLFGPALALLGEIIAAAFRRSQLTASEKADAEGMLLLKDPDSMLSALESCIRQDNVVVQAGEAYGPLFYCWTGDSTDDADDPAWRRVARLREVLGVDGHVFEEEELPEGAIAPPPPRLVVEPPARYRAVGKEARDE